MTHAPTVLPGWYPCPQTAGLMRWHDGSTWTTATRPAAAPPAAAVRPGTVWTPAGGHPATSVPTQHAAPAGTGGRPGPSGQVPISRFGTLGFAADAAASAAATSAPGWSSAPAPAHGPKDAVHWLLPVGRSGVSIAAGYVALVALFLWVLGPVSLLLGVLGLRRARTGGHGSGRSWFGVVVGVLATIGTVLVGVPLLLDGGWPAA